MPIQKLYMNLTDIKKNRRYKQSLTQDMQASKMQTSLHLIAAGMLQHPADWMLISGEHAQQPGAHLIQRLPCAFQHRPGPAASVPAGNVAVWKERPCKMLECSLLARPTVSNNAFHNGLDTDRVKKLVEDSIILVLIHKVSNLTASCNNFQIHTCAS